jgi:hypothetical protein
MDAPVHVENARVHPLNEHQSSQLADFLMACMMDGWFLLSSMGLVGSVTATAGRGCKGCRGRRAASGFAIADCGSARVKSRDASVQSLVYGRVAPKRKEKKREDAAHCSN